MAEKDKKLPRMTDANWLHGLFLYGNLNITYCVYAIVVRLQSSGNQTN